MGVLTRVWMTARLYDPFQLEKHLRLNLHMAFDFATAFKQLTFQVASLSNSGAMFRGAYPEDTYALMKSQVWTLLNCHRLSRSIAKLQYLFPNHV